MYELPIPDGTIRKILYGRQGFGGDTWSYTTHNSVAMLQSMAADIHLRCLQSLAYGSPSLPSYRALNLADTTTFSIDTRVPAVRVACLPQDSVALGSSALNLEFPVLQEFEQFRTRDRPSATVVFDVTTAVRDALVTRGLAVPDGAGVLMGPDDPGILIIPVHPPAGNASSIGFALFRQIRGGTHDGLWATLTCTVDARWAAGVSLIRLGQDGDTHVVYEYDASQGGDMVRTQLSQADYLGVSLSDFHPNHPALWDHIQIQSSWFDLLSPNVPDLPALGLPADESTVDRSLIERLTDLSQFPSSEWHDETQLKRYLRGTELMISMLFTNGLPRVVLYRQMQVSDFMPDFNIIWEDGHELCQSIVNKGDREELVPMSSALVGQNSTRVVMRATLHGYSMSVENWFDYFVYNRAASARTGCSCPYDTLFTTLETQRSVG